MGAFSPPSLYSSRCGLIKPQTKGQGMKIVDKAPIIKITANTIRWDRSEFAAKCIAFGESLKVHGSAVITRPNRPDFPIEKSARKAVEIIYEAPLYDSFEPPTHLFAYMLNGFPVGMMVCSGDEEGYEYIDAIACNPGLSGCGAALIERATDLSLDSGRWGKVCLTPLNSTVARIYESYGFKQRNLDAEDKKMVLDPASSPMWSFVSTPYGPSYRINPKLSYIGD